jgi:hypothetical protein
LTKFETPCWLSTPTTTPVICTSWPLRGVVLPEPWMASIASGVGGASHGWPHAVPSAAPDGPAKSAALSSVSCSPVPAALRVKVKSAPVVGNVRPGPSAQAVPGAPTASWVTAPASLTRKPPASVTWKL